mgnify:CR=1 FL=1
MPHYPFMQVDAFTTTPLAGNPCAIVFDADDLSAETMQAIAREMNLSETAFVMQSQVADVRARYFTPAEEIPLAGHPTIATIHALVETGRLTLSDAQTRFSLELEVGPIDVDVFAGEDGQKRVVMSQKRPSFQRTYDPHGVLPIFNLTLDDLLPGAPIQTVSTGTPQLMIPLRTLSALRAVELDIPAYTAFRTAGDFFSPHLFVLQGITPDGDTFARHFGVPPDTLEDPFTGSATGNMAAYLWHHGLIDKPSFIAEQGHWLNRPGTAVATVIGSRDDIETVQVGGTAVTVLRGELSIP